MLRGLQEHPGAPGAPPGAPGAQIFRRIFLMPSTVVFSKPLHYRVHPGDFKDALGTFARHPFSSHFVELVRP
jgi:hypothetical protein